MANQCPKCGKELPEGEGVCPSCGAAAQGGAALFTHMTAETERWQKKAEKPERTKQEKRRIAILCAAAGLVAIAVFLLLFLQPSARVIRAIHAGRYEQAAEIYWSESALAEKGSASVDKAVLEAAQTITKQYADHEKDADTAAGEISALSAIGRSAEQGALAEIIESFRALSESRSHMTIAREYALSGEHLAAREEYLQVREDDPDYAAAQQAAKDSLNDYAESVIRQADLSIQEGNLTLALGVLREGEKTLLTYDFYYEKLDNKSKAVAELLSDELLERSAALAGETEYREAAALLQSYIEGYGLSRAELEERRAEYEGLARSQYVAETAAKAQTLLEEGSYEAAFAWLDPLREEPELPAEEVAQAISALEDAYAARILAAAEETFGGDRDRLPDALTQLREALKLRPVEAIRTRLEELSLYLPFSLADEDYIEKVGVIFRSGSAFEGLDGTKYEQGWIWGDNESEVSFNLGGNYDRLEAVFAVRREDDTEAAASFEILCDGETVYRSEKLEHTAEDPAPVPVSVSVQGCQRLTLRFLNDYAVSTTEDGFCYHGLCSPVVTKDIPG